MVFITDFSHDHYNKLRHVHFGTTCQSGSILLLSLSPTSNCFLDWSHPPPSTRGEYPLLFFSGPDQFLPPPQFQRQYHALPIPPTVASTLEQHYLSWMSPLSSPNRTPEAKVAALLQGLGIFCHCMSVLTLPLLAYFLDPVLHPLQEVSVPYWLVSSFFWCLTSPFHHPLVPMAVPCPSLSPHCSQHTIPITTP